MNTPFRARRRKPVFFSLAALVKRSDQNLTPTDSWPHEEAHMSADRPAAGLRMAMVCLSNLNRSMEAHSLFNKNGYKPRSFGTGAKVKLPGESVNTPNVYDFGTPYETILKDLRKKNERRYEKNGMLRMVDRDSKIKDAPERWHDEQTAQFDLVVTFDRIVFEAVVDEVTHRPRREGVGIAPVHVVNVETKDTHEEAANGALAALDLVERINAHYDEWQDQIQTLLDEVEQKSGLSLLHACLYY